MVARAKARGRHVVCADALEWLDTHRGEYNGVFSAHFIEHLPHEQALGLVQRAAGALRPAGRLIVTTPNVRGLFAHLEGFYRHYDHVRFYHPDLLAFYFAQAGLTSIETGDNPEVAAPLYPELRQALVRIDHLAALLVLPDTANPVRQAWRAVKRRLLANHERVYSEQIAILHDVLRSLIERLDRPVECFATGVAP